ncbi:MAG TPA: hypothetical protein VFZ14_11080 [Burkholderiales bacterium]|nr:hypothetical protein [Burkholderiales bacterium]
MTARRHLRGGAALSGALSGTSRAIGGRLYCIVCRNVYWRSRVVKALIWIVVAIFVIGLLVVFGVLDLIF